MCTWTPETLGVRGGLAMAQEIPPNTGLPSSAQPLSTDFVKQVPFAGQLSYLKPKPSCDFCPAGLSEPSFQASLTVFRDRDMSLQRLFFSRINNRTSFTMLSLEKVSVPGCG